jgi:hypothetical protein
MVYQTIIDGKLIIKIIIMMTDLLGLYHIRPYFVGISPYIGLT